MAPPPANAALTAASVRGLPERSAAGDASAVGQLLGISRGGIKDIQSRRGTSGAGRCALASLRRRVDGMHQSTAQGVGPVGHPALCKNEES